MLIQWPQQMSYSGLNVSSLGIWVEVIQHQLGVTSSAIAASTIFVGTRPGPARGGSRTEDVPNTVTATGMLAGGPKFTYP